MTNRKYKEKLEDLLLVCRKHLYKVDEPLIRRAFEFGFNAHRFDKRASGEPFFEHPYEVARIVAKEIPLDDISVAAALLHDVAEDTEYQIRDIRAEFGDTIADIVDGATKISAVNFTSIEASQVENYRKMLLSMVNDIRVMLVKFADRLHNMRTIDFLPPERQKRIARETLEVYAPFAHRFGLANIKWELEDLAFKTLQREDYDAIAHELKARRRERERYLKEFARPIEEKLRAENIKYELSARPKHIYSIYNKMVKRNKPLSEIYDLFAVRIILDTNDEKECYNVLGIISSIYTANSERFKDYISLPKQNGYKSIHTTVLGPEGKMVEVQIRTKAMHEIAERGVAAHWAYKEDAQKIDEQLRNWVNWIRDIIESSGDDETEGTHLIESFKLSLFQDEIYVFTPKGDLKILPKGATPVDFAYEIHSKVGDHCIAAKVNGRIVPLETPLRSGDQVEIITSKNQNPNPDWEKFVVSQKAKAHIRRWLREEQRKAIEEGKAIWEKKLKKAKLSINEDELQAFLTRQRIENVGKFYLAIQQEKINPDEIIKLIQDDQRHATAVVTPEGKVEGLFDKFISTARGIASGIVLNGSQENYMHSYARCCNPIPGDPVVGFVTKGEGVKIHRRSCKNIQLMLKMEPERVIDVQWPAESSAMFVAGVRIIGEDRTGMLSDITHAISTYQNTNIRSVNLDSRDSMFEGVLVLNVRDTEHLERLLERIKKIKGVTRAERLDQ
jgi:guanosine-3',5'-bis(diphosphate) 3'-pyrophosphohydrolase